MTNAHPLPGPGIITGLSSVGKPLGRALLLLAEMSSSGNLAKGEYTREAVRMAKKDREFVVGFIAMHRVEEDLPQEERESREAGQGEDEDWLILTPGVGLVAKGDAMGQQYRTPRQVILESGCDVIIVGRGIYKSLATGGAQEVKEEAERKEGWAAYEERVGGA
jgi:orotidine-5'-phosphate decarboxylase